MNLLHGLLALVATVVFFVGLSWIGEALLKRVLRVDLAGGQLPVFSFAAGIGYAVISTLVLGCALAGVLSRWVLGGVAAVVIVSGVAGLARWIFRPDSVFRRALRITGLPLAAVALVTVPFLILPPVAQDALVYHLEMPRQHLLHGGLTAFPLNAYSYFPEGVEMVYLLSLSLFPPWLVQFIHFGFLLLTAHAVFEGLCALDAGLRPSVAAAGSILVFCFLPSLWIDSRTAYIDAAWMFFSFLILAGLFLYYRLGRPEVLVPVFFLLGFYPAIKYPGFYFLLVLILAVLLARILQKHPLPLSFRPVAIGSVVSLLASFPYFLRNWLQMGNPFYPFFPGLFYAAPNGYLLDLEQSWMGFLQRYGREFSQPLLKPFSFLAVAVNTRLDDPEWFDGVIGPFLLLWMIAVPFLWRKREPRSVLVYGIACYLVVWGISLRQVRFLLPILPAILFVFLAAAADWSREIPFRKHLLAGAMGLLLAFDAIILVPAMASLPVDGYLLGRVDKTAFLTGQLPFYPCQRYINEHLPAKAVVWCLMTGNENFYLDRHYLADYVVEDYSFHRWLAGCDSPDEIAARFRTRGVTHLLVNVRKLFLPELYMDLRPGRREEKMVLGMNFFRMRTRMLFYSGDFAVFEMLP